MKIVFLALSFFILSNIYGAERSNFTTNLQNVASLDPRDIYFIRPKHYCCQPLTINSLFFPNNTELIINSDCSVARRYCTWWYIDEIE